MDSFTPWNWKTAWIRSLADRAFKICSKENLPKELETIRKFASWNNYPNYIVKSIIKHVQRKQSDATKNDKNDEKETPTVFFHINYGGEKVESLVKTCFKKLRRCSNKNVKFIARYTVTKMSFFTNTKDKIDTLSKSHVVYEFKCPGCNSSFIGKTDRTLCTRTHEHAQTRP